MINSYYIHFYDNHYQSWHYWQGYQGWHYKRPCKSVSSTSLVEKRIIYSSHSVEKQPLKAYKRRLTGYNNTTMAFSNASTIQEVDLLFQQSFSGAQMYYLSIYCIVMI